MSRTAIIIALLVVPFLATNASAASRAASCGQKVQGFNIYERLEHGKVVEKYSTFDIDEWSDHSAFEGVLVMGHKDSTVEIEIRKEGKSLKKGSWPLKGWDQNKAFMAADGLDTTDFFQNAEEDSYFVIRLVKNGKTICETSPKEISLED